jgi:hypothetical protein
VEPRVWARVLHDGPRGRRADAGGRYTLREGRQTPTCIYGGTRTGESARHGEKRRKEDRRQKKVFKGVKKKT